MKIYYKQQQFLRQANRIIKDYEEDQPVSRSGMPPPPPPPTAASHGSSGVNSGSRNPPRASTSEPALGPSHDTLNAGSSSSGLANDGHSQFPEAVHATNESVID